MSAPICLIEFENNPEKVVYTGTTVTGTVRLTLPEQITVRCVYIKISGVAHAKKTKRRGKFCRKYKCDRVYSNHKKIFVGNSACNLIKFIC